MNQTWSALSWWGLVAAFILIGCAPSSAIAPYGKDTYILSVDAAWGGYSPGQLQVRAAQEASAFCTGQGKVSRVRYLTGVGTYGWETTSSSMIFSCIYESDPENTIPEFRIEADAVIEVKP